MSQKFIIQELGLNYDNLLEKKIDDIIFGLKTGKGIDNLKVFSEPKFTQILNSVDNVWTRLKDEIQVYRRTRDPEQIFKLSDEFFEFSNELVFIANELSEQKLEFLSNLRIFILLIYIILASVFIYQILSFISFKKDKKILIEQAIIDQMSGLANRWSCDLKAEHYLELKSLPNLLCVSIDLNDLKSTNDTLGHSYGDQLIISFSKILNEVLSPFGFIGRSGGDEFVGYFENFTKEKEGELFLALENAINEHNAKDGAILISYSYGSALSSDFPNLNSDQLMQIADENMYKNKKIGKIKNNILQSPL